MLWEQGHCSWVGMKPQEICLLVRVQASCIAVTDVRGVTHPAQLQLSWEHSAKLTELPAPALSLCIAAAQPLPEPPTLAPKHPLGYSHRIPSALARSCGSKSSSDVGILPKTRTLLKGKP